MPENKFNVDYYVPQGMEVIKDNASKIVVSYSTTSHTHDYYLFYYIGKIIDMGDISDRYVSIKINKHGERSVFSLSTEDFVFEGIEETIKHIDKTKQEFSEEGSFLLKEQIFSFPLKREKTLTSEIYLNSAKSLKLK